MDLLKLVVVFAVIIAFMAFHKPLLPALCCAILAAILLFRLTPREAVGALWVGTASWNTVQVLLVFYSISFLTRMLIRRGSLETVSRALNGIFHNNRVNASVATFFLGLLPGPSTVLICGPIVRDSVGDSLDDPRKASMTSYFRHISESFLPTYTDIFIAIELTRGLVSVSSFVLGMIPMVLVLFLCGYLFFLRKVPKGNAEAAGTAAESKSAEWKLLFQNLWTILLTVLLILLFNIPVWVAVTISIVLNAVAGKFRKEELGACLREALDVRLLVTTWLTMLFKEVLAVSGVIEELPGYMEQLPIPQFVIFALIFFLGSIAAGSQAMTVMCVPLLVAALAPGQNLFPLFILCMCMEYAAMQISPIHICLSICAEDYHVSLISMIRKTIPVILTFVGFVFAYYGILTLVLG